MSSLSSPARIFILVNLINKEGVLSAGNVLGSGFTLYKNWEISVDLKLKRNNNEFFTNVFMFTVKGLTIRVFRDLSSLC